MTSRSNVSHIVQRMRAIGGIGVLSIAMLAGTAGFAQAASVTPTPINDGNPTCADFNADWTQLKVDGGDVGDGVFTDGTLIVTISNFVGSNSGTPGSFDWSSNIGVDAVFVKAGNDKHNLYVYDPESTGDTDLGPQAGNGNGISHISFCYDEDEEPTPTPTPEVTPTPTPEVTPTPTPEVTPTPTPEVTPTPTPEVTPTPTPEATPTPTGSELPGESEHPTPSGGVGGVTGTPQPTPPATDTLTIDASDAAVGPSMLVVAGLLAGVAFLAMRRPARAKR